MTPVHYSSQKARFILLAILLFFVTFLMIPLAVADGEDEAIVFFVAPLLSLVCLAGGILFVIQAFSNNPVLSITEEGIYVRYMPAFKPVFSPWSDIWAVKMANDFIGKDVVVVLVKNPYGILGGIKGWIPKNHARNAHKTFGSPLAVRTTYLKGEAIPIYKIIQAEIEKRKTVEN